MKIKRALMALGICRRGSTTKISNGLQVKSYSIFTIKLSRKLFLAGDIQQFKIAKVPSITCIGSDSSTRIITSRYDTSFQKSAIGF